MNEYDCVGCLFCLSGQEKDVVTRINHRNGGIALFPQKTKFFRGKNQWRKEEVAIIPGYVFVYLKESEADNIYLFKEMSQVIRILHYGDEGAWRLTDSDRAFADWVWKQNGIINTIDAVQIGDHIEIVDTELKHLHGRVARMDRRRRTVMIELDGAGIINNVWLPYQVIQKIENKSFAEKVRDR